MNSTSQLENIWLAQCENISRCDSTNRLTPVYNFKDDINEEDFENKESIQSPKYFHSWCCCISSTSGFLKGILVGCLTAGLILAVLIALLMTSSSSNVTTTTSTITTATTTTTSSSTSTTSTTKTSTTSTTTTSTTSATTTSTTTSTTTTTNMLCGTTCVNTTISSSSLVAFYKFDNNTIDTTGQYPLTWSGSVSVEYVSGWANSAIKFQKANEKYLYTSHIPLDSRSFTIEFWFFTTELTGSTDSGIVSEKESSSTQQALHLVIRNNKAYFGFYDEDTSGITTINANQWYHIAFVYDYSTTQQFIYLNGILEEKNNRLAFLGTIGDFTIGGAFYSASTSSGRYYSGYIDHFMVYQRAKSSCEIFLDATLACYFRFDSPFYLNDSGPNMLTASQFNATSTIGRVNQAFEFSSIFSYIIISGITALSTSSYTTEFTISMWINPINIIGGATLIQASTQADGQGSCLIMWGFSSNGTLIANVLNSGNSAVSAKYSSSLLQNTWTHVAQTFSSASGNRLYINGILVNTVAVSGGRPVGSNVFLGGSPSGMNSCPSGSITIGQFYGSLDEFRVFGQELSSVDICRLAYP